MKILIAGDFVINKLDPDFEVHESILKLFEESDYRIVNLEAPVSENNEKVLKTGPHLKSNKTTTLQVFKKLGIDLVTLANNHIKDYGEKGVWDTINFCKKNSIQTVGAGMNLKEASTVFYLSTGNGKVGFLNIAENEWSSASVHSAGSWPLDLINNINSIKEAKKNADLVILIMHGGHEYFNYPSPKIQELYRFFIDQGVDAVIGHHPHCISGFEYYKNKPIYYSLGNFIFTKDNNNKEWYKGMILQIEIINNMLKVNHMFVKQNKTNHGLKPLTKSENELLNNEVENYSNVIINKELLDEKWNEFVNHKGKLYLEYCSGMALISNKYIRAVLRKFRIKLINKRSASLFLNLLRCESHNNISKDVLRNYLNSGK